MGRVARPRAAASPKIYVTRPSLPPIEEYEALLRKIWKSRQLSNSGPFLKEFELRLARYLPARRVAALANGTLALQLALRAVGGRRGTVITTPFTFAATTTALLWEGFTPEFVDVDPETFVLDPALVAERIGGDDVVGLLPVHVFGNPAGARELAALAKEHARWTIFDAAHSFGVRPTEGRLFDLGDASILSFHATKNFHTFEGGAVASRDRAIDRRIRELRNFGFLASDDIRDIGINAKMNEAQAAMGIVNLRHVGQWIRDRGVRARLYRDLLAPLGVVGFQRLEVGRYNFAYLPVLLPDRRRRDGVFRSLRRHGIYARRYFYPLTSHFSFAPPELRRPCPVAEDIADRILCLPMYDTLPLDQVHRVVDRVKEALGRGAAA